MALICPACRKIRLKPQTDKETGLEIDVCPKCYGLWFDAQELSQFFQSEGLKKKFFLPEDVSPAQTTGYTITTRARECPRCHRPLNEKLFGDVSIDLCDSCQGLWLDDGELQRIVTQYQKGHRGEKTVATELSKGLDDGGDRPSLRDVFSVILAFLGQK